jgi:predicted Ser/Thr protein kinase
MKANPAGKPSSGMCGFGIPVPNPAVGTSGLVALEARTVAAERKNANLEAQVAQLKQMQAQVGPQVLFGGNTFEVEWA